MAKADLEELDAKGKKLVVLIAGPNTPSYVQELYDEMLVDRTAMLLKVEALKIEIAAATGSLFDESRVTYYMSHMYGTDQVSQDVRAELGLKLTRLIERIWLWSYDCALFQLKGKAQLYNVLLPQKVKPPVDKAGNPMSALHPFFDLALAGTLKPPSPRVRVIKERTKE